MLTITHPGPSTDFRRRRMPAGIAPAACLACFFTLGILRSAAASDQGLPGKPDYSRNPEWFPHIQRPYTSRWVPTLGLQNTQKVQDLIRDGKLKLSLVDLAAAVKENNLDILTAAIGTSFAETDILRAKGGGAPRGGPGIQIPSSLFAGAIGAGVGSTGGLGGSGSAGGISGGARAVTVRASGSFDPSLLLNFSIDRTASPLNTIRVSGVPNVITSTTAFQTRYLQAFTTGTTISVSFNNQRQSSTQQFLRFNPSFVSSFSFSFTQQLLNGFGWAVNRRFLNVAKNDRQIAQETLRLQVSTTLAQAMSLFWDLAAARDNVRAAEKSLAVAQQLYDDNRARLEIGTVAGIDVVTTESEVASRKRDLVIAQTGLQVIQEQMKTILSREMDAALASAAIEATDPLPDPRDADVPKLSEALAQAMKSRPEIRQAEGNLLNQAAAIKYARNLLKPTLMVFGLYSGSGLSGESVFLDPSTGNLVTAPGGISQALRQLFGMDFPDYAFGFSFTISLRNRSAQADNMRARLEQRMSETALQGTRSGIALEVRQAIIGLTQAKARVEAAHQATSLTDQLLKAEEEKLLSGLSTPYIVLRIQRDLLVAQLSEVQARAGYAKALVELDRSTGVLDTK
jgi:outer membrane protein TolC